MMGTDDASRVWGAVAEAWDAEVDEVDDHSAPATDALFERLDIQPGTELLELAAGPGSLARRWSDALSLIHI